MIALDYITHEEIRLRAYSLWEREGRPEGRDGEHWHAAEQAVRAERDAVHDEAEKPVAAF